MEKRELMALRWLERQSGHASRYSFIEQFNELTYDDLIVKHMRLDDGLLRLTHAGERAIKP